MHARLDIAMPAYTAVLGRPPALNKMPSTRAKLLALVIAVLLLCCTFLPTRLRPRTALAHYGAACARAAPAADAYRVRIRPAHLVRPRSYGNVALPSGARLWAFRNVASSAQDDYEDRFVDVRPPVGRRAPWGFGAQGAICANGLAISGYASAFATAFFDAEEDGEWLDAGLDTARDACAVARDAVFLVADTRQDTAFGHWLGESAAFLHLWAELVALHPGLRLVVRNARRFKTLVAAAYGIAPAQVLAASALPANASNLVYFPPLYLHNNAFLDLGMGARAFADLMRTIRRHAGLGECGGAEGAAGPRLLIMPRGSRENFLWNDRAVPLKRRRMEDGIWEGGGGRPRKGPEKRVKQERRTHVVH